MHRADHGPACRRLIRLAQGLVLLLATGVALADPLTGKVVGVLDGDTIRVLDSGNREHLVRIGGIDAPERGQAFAQRSRQHLSWLVFDRDVEVFPRKHDRYRRIVGKLMVAAPDCLRPDCAKTLDAGLAQVAAGFAWWYRHYAKEQSADDAIRYRDAEADARTRRLGLWADAEPLAPWDWRKQQRGR